MLLSSPLKDSYSNKFVEQKVLGSMPKVGMVTRDFHSCFPLSDGSSVAARNPRNIGITAQADLNNIGGAWFPCCSPVLVIESNGSWSS